MTRQGGRRQGRWPRLTAPSHLPDLRSTNLRRTYLLPVQPALPRTASRVAAGYDSLDPAARAVLDGFPVRRAVTEADLARLSGQPIQLVLAALPVLVNLRLVTAAREGYRLADRRVAS